VIACLASSLFFNVSAFKELVVVPLRKEYKSQYNEIELNEITKVDVLFWKNRNPAIFIVNSM